MSDHVMEVVVIIEVFLDLHSGCECSNAMERYVSALQSDFTLKK